MKKRVFFVVLVLMGAVALSASPLSADWVEGTVEYRSGNRWVRIEIGDSVDDKALVRLGRGSFAEFSSSNTRLVFTAEGSYNLAELVKNSSPVRAASLAGKLDRIVNHSAPRRSTVAGVRGNFEGRPDQTEWLEDDESPTMYADEGYRFMSAKNYSAAVRSFAEAARLAFGNDREEYLYNLALASALDGKTIDSVKTLRSMASSGSWLIMCMNPNAASARPSTMICMPR